MKKQIILTSLFLFLMGIIYSFSIPEDKTTYKQDVGVAFGQRIGCIGTGLCLIVPQERFAGATYDALAEVEVDNNGKTTLKVKKNSISMAKAEEQFKDDWFEMTKDISIPITSNSTTQKKGYSATIKKGKFPIIENSEYYIISF